MIAGITVENRRKKKSMYIDSEQNLFCTFWIFPIFLLKKKKWQKVLTVHTDSIILLPLRQGDNRNVKFADKRIPGSMWVFAGGCDQEQGIEGYFADGTKRQSVSRKRGTDGASE